MDSGPIGRARLACDMPAPRTMTLLGVGVAGAVVLAAATSWRAWRRSAREATRRTCVLVTGGTGYIAQFVLEALAADSALDVRYTHRGQRLDHELLLARGLPAAARGVTMNLEVRRSS